MNRKKCFSYFLLVNFSINGSIMSRCCSMWCSFIHIIFYLPTPVFGESSNGEGLGIISNKCTYTPQPFLSFLFTFFYKQNLFMWCWWLWPSWIPEGPTIISPGAVLTPKLRITSNSLVVSVWWQPWSHQSNLSSPLTDSPTYHTVASSSSRQTIDSG